MLDEKRCFTCYGYQGESELDCDGSKTAEVKDDNSK